jgi:hypothetical protein
MLRMDSCLAFSSLPAARLGVQWSAQPQMWLFGTLCLAAAFGATKLVASGCCLQVNLPSGDFYRIQKAAAAADFWTQLLCIAADRNPSLGMYYPGKLVAA